MIQLGLFAVLLFSASAEALSQTNTERINIQFEGGNLETNSGRMLSELIQRNLVVMKPVVNTGSLTPSELLESAKDWPKGLMTEDLSASLCKANPHVCKVESSGSPDWRLQKTTSTQNSALAPNFKCADAAIPAYVLCLPDISISSYITPKRVPANPKLDNLSDKVVKNLRGCDTYNESCRALIRALNPQGGAITKDGVTSMVLPAKSIQITLPGDAHTRKLVVDTQQEVLGRLRKEGALTELSNDVRLSRPVLMRPNAPSPNGASAASDRAQPVLVCPKPSMGTSSEALEKMGFPKAPMSPIVESVAVGIWDGYADPEHCLIRKGQQIKRFDAVKTRNPRAGTPPERRACGTAREFGNLAFDHAPFVTSLIAGKSWQTKRIGTNPSAPIWQLEYVDDNLDKPDPIFPAVKAALFVKVINISQSYEELGFGVQSNLSHLLRGEDGASLYRILFVAAAGNDGQTFDSSSRCKVIPACWSQESKGVNSIISVVALDHTGDAILKNSNRGLAFDVAAVGETSGAVYGNAVAKHCGTSFAAPYVTGLASLIMERLQMRTTEGDDILRIKRRILFTSTFSEALSSSVRFGKIDFRRALNFEKSTLALKPGKCPSSGCQMEGLADLDTTLTIMAGYDPNGLEIKKTPLTVPMRNVRRIVASTLANGELRYWMVIKEEDGSLARLRRVMLKSGGLVFEGKKVDIDDIEDFTSCSLSKKCNLPSKG